MPSDWKGHKLFEGDIVQAGRHVSSITGTVVFEYCSFWAKSARGQLLLSMLPWKKIGNKFDNPELLDNEL